MGKTIHVQTIIVRLASEDWGVEGLDNLNERIKRFFKREIIDENERTGDYDGVVVTVDARHQDVTLTDSQLDILDAIADDDEVPLDAILTPPPGGKEWMN